MTKPNYTHIHMLFDRSGSMAGHESDVEGWFKTFIAGQKIATGECTISAEQFDDMGTDETVVWCDIKNAPETFKLVPRGMTPLRDALAKSIIKLGEKLASLKEEDRPSKVIVIVQTDGMENASREYSLQALKNLVTQQQETYSWEFMFLGANIDSFGTAGSMGMRSATTANFGQTTKGYQTSATVMSAAVTRYRSVPGATLGYTEDEKDTLQNTVTK